MRRRSGEPANKLQSIPTFTSVLERDNAEASGSYPLGFVWQRTQSGTVVETGYVDPAGIWHSTGDASIEVADYDAAVALPSPQDGDQVTLLDQVQRHADGDLVYRDTLAGGLVGEWLPKSVANLNDYLDKSGVPSRIITTNGGGTDTAVNRFETDEWGDISDPGGSVTDSGGDILFDAVTGRAGMSIGPFDTVLSAGEKILFFLRADVLLFNAGGGNAASRCICHDGEHEHNISLTRGGINQFGFSNNAAATLSSGIDMSGYNPMLAVFEVGAGGSLFSRGWSPETGWTGPSLISVEGGFDAGVQKALGCLTDKFSFGQRLSLRKLLMIRLNT